MIWTWFPGIGFSAPTLDFSTNGLRLGNSMFGFSWADFTFCKFEDLGSQGLMHDAANAEAEPWGQPIP
jgi:hypothetical protein